MKLIKEKKTDQAIEETKKILDGKFESSKKVILEKFLEGEELSYFVIVDKNSYHFIVEPVIFLIGYLYSMP